MSEIVAGAAGSVAPVLWRKVTLVEPGAARRELAQREAEEETKRRLEQARHEGLEQGLAAGRSETEQQIPAVLENIARAQSGLAQIRERVSLETARELVHLARTVAARVIHREMVIDPDALAGLVRAAYLKVQAREIARVRMHPAIETVVASTLEQCGGPTGVVLMADPALHEGELLFETAQGTLDASLETQLSELERALLDKVGKTSIA
jgi:flagellar assembly protein FliH